MISLRQAINSFISVGHFFDALTHGHATAAVAMAVSLVIAGEGRWLLRAFMALLLIALLHDAPTGHHLTEDLR